MLSAASHIDAARMHRPFWKECCCLLMAPLCVTKKSFSEQEECLAVNMDQPLLAARLLHRNYSLVSYCETIHRGLLVAARIVAPTKENRLVDCELSYC